MDKVLASYAVLDFFSDKKKDIIEVTGMSNQTYCKSVKSLKNKLISIGIMPASMMAASV